MTIDIDEVREAVPCPVCTAHRGEECRERDGSKCPTHAERIDRYALESDLPLQGGPTDAGSADDSIQVVKE